MENTESQKSRFNIKNILTKGNNKVKLFFVLLSVFLWFLSKLSKEGYTAVVDIPVKYDITKADRKFGKDPLSTISVSLTAPGFTILKYKLRSLTSLKVKLPQVERKLEARKSYWLPNDHLGLVQNFLDPDTEVRSVKPDTVYFNFNKVVQKMVPVVLDIDNQQSKDLKIYGKPIIKPDSIRVIGPEDLLKEIFEVTTEQLTIEGEKEKYKVVLDLIELYEKELKLSDDEVSVSLEFSKMTEATVNIPIEVFALPSQFDLKIFPENVKLTYQVAIKDYDKVSKNDFRIFTDCSKIEMNAEKRYLNLQFSSFADYISNVHVEPKRVEFILSEK